MTEKLRTVKTIGTLYLLGKSYPLVREEQFTEHITDGRHGWTVIDPESHRMVDEDFVAYETMFVTSNAPWLIEFREDSYLVKDVMLEEVFEATEQEEQGGIDI